MGLRLRRYDQPMDDGTDTAPGPPPVSTSRGLRSMLISKDRPSLSTAARERRQTELARNFPELSDLHVVDLGGTPGFWKATQLRPAHVTLVNLGQFDELPSWMTSVESDVCTFRPGQRFDMVFSNSVIEHLGGYARRKQFADTVRALGDRWWVQTPNRYFPVEPHWVMPAQQFLPLKVRGPLSRRWTFGHMPPSNAADAVEECLMVELLTATEMRHLFPEATLWRERLGGVTKSLVMVKR